MKKKLLITIMLAMAVAASACGKKEDTSASETSTEAVSEADESEEGSDESASSDASQEASEEENEDEDYIEDEGYYEGTVTAMNGTQITLQGPDGTSYVFDIANAELDPDYDILPGALVDVSYEGEKSDVTPVQEVSVVMSLEQQADSLGIDPVLVGTVTDMTPSEITVTDPNGKPHELSSVMAYVVTVNNEELNVGSEVDVTYVGTLNPIEDEEDEEGSIGLPIATKIVLASARNTEEAKQNIVVGTVNYVDPETNTFMIDGDTMSFEFSCTPEIAASLSEGNTVKVIYDGNLYNRIVKAVSVSPVEVVGVGR